MFLPCLASMTTVNQEADDTSLVDLAKVKTVLGQTTTAYDAFLETAIDFASAEISQFCNRTFVVEEVTDYFWPGRGSSYTSGRLTLLQLSRFPVIVDNSLVVVEDGTTLTKDTDYKVDSIKGQLIRLNSDTTNPFPTFWSPLAISVTYNSGYASIPNDIQDAATRMVMARWSARGRDPNIRQVSHPEMGEVQFWVPDTPTGNMSPDIEDILDNYRVPLVA